MEPLSVGPIFGINGPAREYSSWGAAAKGDSKMGAIKDLLAGYPEAAAGARADR